MTGAGRPAARGPNHQPIPVPGTGRPSIDQLYRDAAGDRALFHRLVTWTWPTTTTESRRS